MINFNALVDNLNIPVLRKRIHTAWLKLMVSALSQVQNWFNQRLIGSAYPIFNYTTNYSAYTTIRYGRSCYWCTSTPPIGLFPIPTNTFYWYKIIDDYIGIIERSKYSSQKVMLEFALNRRFSPTTITPPFGPSIPSIYITNNPSYSPILWSAPNNTETFTYSTKNNSSIFWYSGLGNPTITTYYNYTINVPSAVMTSVSATFSEAVFIITQEAMRYNLAGLIFNVVQY